MSQAIITRRGGGGSGKVFTPLYTGAMNLVYTNAKQTGGYAEFTSSGTLTWLTEPPDETDLFCVGGGGAGGMYHGYPDVGGGGGAGGYTSTALAKELPESIDITIGAGGSGRASQTLGSASNPGGQTSIGSLCTAAGGKGGKQSASGSSSDANGGAGGSGGGGGGSGYGGGAGGSNGAGGGATGGAGQGTPTTDLLGRKHAGGGGGGKGGIRNTYPEKNAGGVSDFSAGSGGTAGNYIGSLGGSNFYCAGGAGGGGYGGGGGGGGSGGSGGTSGADGGQGFAMIAWGTYKEDLGLT